MALLDKSMTRSHSHPSTEPMHVVDVSEHQRHIALAVPRSGLGVGDGTPMWLVFSADKDTGELTCAIRSVLPGVFTPLT